MKVVTELIPSFSVAPRVYPQPADTLILAFENGFTTTFTWSIIGQLLSVTLDSTEGITQGTTYSFTITNNGTTIYKGKIIFLKDGTDVQNYTNQSQDTKRWK
jgi:hypothetical protein